jgi:Protein of unknwon function (DUF3008)
MTFFYDLNKKLSDLAAKQTLNESASHQAKTTMKHVDASDASPRVKAELKKASGDIKPGTAGYDDRARMLKAAGVKDTRGPATNEGAKPDFLDVDKDGNKKETFKKAVADKEVAEGILDTVKKVGSAVKKGAGKALDTLGHGSDEDMIRDLQKKVGMPQTGKKPMAHMKEAQGGIKQIIGSMSGDVAKFKQDGDLSDALYNALFDYYSDSGEMPYGTAKARDGDPYEWIGNRLEQELNVSENVDKEAFAALAPPTDKITFADKIAGAKKEVDEMLGDVAAEAMKKALGGGMGRSAEMEEKEDNSPFTAHKRPRAERPKVGSTERGALHDIEHTATGRKVTRRVDPNTGHSVGSDDNAPASGEKRGRGRPAGKGAGKSIGAKGPSGKSKLMTKEAVGEDDIEVIERLMDNAFAEGNNALGNALQDVLERIQGDQDEDQYDDDKQVSEKAVSKKQQRFMGMVHAAKKGEKPASKEVAKAAKGMGKKDAEDFASTKHKGLPEKKKTEKKKEVEETTVAGSVATAPAKAAKGGVFGKGVYEGAIAESFNKKLDTVLTEGMSINLSVGEDGTKSLSVNATNEDAEQLAQLLKMAGLGGEEGAQHACPTCGESACGCQQVDEELANSPNPNYSNTDTMVNTLSGGLNGRKTTGQTTVPVIANQDRQTSMAESSESRLWELYQRYSK